MCSGANRQGLDILHANVQLNINKLGIADHVPGPLPSSALRSTSPNNLNCLKVCPIFLPQSSRHQYIICQ